MLDRPAYSPLSPCALAEVMATELTQTPPQAVERITAEIRRRHAAAVDAVLFYGSCLRTGTTPRGVLDFYVLVSSYRAAYTRRLLSVLNAGLPPNVFYVEVGVGPDILRAKYAVISTADFERGAGPCDVAPIVWARFCQPARLVFVRNPAVQATVIRAASQAVLTFIERTVPLMAGAGATRSFRTADLWQTGFRETYRTEFRPERPDTIRLLYAADPQRYDRVTRLGMDELGRQYGWTYREQARVWTVSLPAWDRRAVWTSWRLRIMLAKTLYALRLLKTTLTFDDWLPYVVWKLGRHTGVWVELSARQRRRPLVWGWSVLFRLLRRRVLR